MLATHWRCSCWSASAPRWGAPPQAGWWPGIASWAARCSNGRSCCRSRCPPMSWPLRTRISSSTRARCKRRCARCSAGRAMITGFLTCVRCRVPRRCSPSRFIPMSTCSRAQPSSNARRHSSRRPARSGWTPGARSGGSNCRSHGRRLLAGPRSRSWRHSPTKAPLSISAGAALALMETLADYGTVAYFGVDTFTTGIYRAWFTLGDRTAAAQLAAALLAFVVAAVALERWSRRARGAHTGPRGRRTAPFAREVLAGPRGVLASVVCAVPLMAGFVLPVLLLLRILQPEPAVAFGMRFLEWAWNSLRVALVAAALAVLVATLVAYAARLAPGAITRFGSRLMTLGYAVPGTVLAVGVLLPLGTLDSTIADWRRSAGVTAPGLLLTGTVFALIYAYVVRFFAVAWNAVEPGFIRITPAMDAAARTLGAGALGALRRVHVPLLARSLAGALLLVFVDVMKELPATLVLRPFNFDTLATQAYQL